MTGSAGGRLVLTTVTRIADLAGRPIAVAPVPHGRWATGDYVVGRVRQVSRSLHQVEGADGRMVDVAPGDLVVGALGRRAATLEAVGDWRDVPASGPDAGAMHLLTSAGLMGLATSASPYLPPMVRLTYAGHVYVDGRPSRMRDWVRSDGDGPGDGPAAVPAIPVVLVIGTSMSAGKTEAAKVVIRLLTDLGVRVVGAKLTGAARYRDPLGMLDAGATAIVDFVDGGLPSTACPEAEYLPALRTSLARIADLHAAGLADVAVVEAGASPMEEYNGAALVEVIGPAVRCTLLCASDPYAVVGIVAAFGRTPDVVAGGAANTSSGRDLVRRLTGLEAWDLGDPANLPRLMGVLAERGLMPCPRATGRSVPARVGAVREGAPQ